MGLVGHEVGSHQPLPQGKEVAEKNLRTGTATKACLVPNSTGGLKNHRGGNTEMNGLIPFRTKLLILTQGSGQTLSSTVLIVTFHRLVSWRPRGQLLSDCGVLSTQLQTQKCKSRG